MTWKVREDQAAETVGPTLVVSNECSAMARKLVQHSRKERGLGRIDDDTAALLQFDIAHLLAEQWCSLLAATSELNECQRAHDEIGGLCFAEGASTSDGTSVSAVRNLVTSHRRSLLALRELAQKWRDEYPVSADMDHSYALVANAYQDCAAELLGIAEKLGDQP